MNKFLMGLLGYMAEADDGAGGAGGGVVDRGDDLVAPEEVKKEAPAAIDPPIDDVPPTDDADDADADADEDAGEDDADAAAAAKKAKPVDDVAPRAKDGKFTKAIPKERFDEMRMKGKEREEALLARISTLEKSASQEVQQQDTNKLESEVQALEEAYQKYLDDGEQGKAKDAMRQIRLKERQIVEVNVEHKSERARVLAVEQFRVDTLLDKLEAEFSVLQPDSDDYDQEIVDEVSLLRTGFERGGLSSSAAIAKAVKYVLGNAAKAAEPADSDEKPKGMRDGVKKERTKEQLRKNIDAAGNQPPKMDAGLDSDKKGGGIDGRAVTDMTEAEFNALPTSTKAKLRGDFVADVAA